MVGLRKNRAVQNIEGVHLRLIPKLGNESSVHLWRVCIYGGCIYGGFTVLILPLLYSMQVSTLYIIYSMPFQSLLI